MWSIYCCCVVALAFVGVNGERLTFNDHGMPIRVVETSTGRGNNKRIDRIEATIHARHLTTNQRVSFPASGPIETYFQAIRETGDERGHLVASQFSGPAQWYNLSPQNVRVNRNVGFQAITTTWFETECEVRKFLKKGGNRQVNWIVNMRYTGDSNRPHEYHLIAEFLENGNILGNEGVNTVVLNPLQRKDGTFWLCRQCRSSNHDGSACTKQ